MIIDGKPILDTLAELYRQKNIKHYMQASYDYCRKHEMAIRQHISEAENQ
jgi:hypothetical protein